MSARRKPQPGADAVETPRGVRLDVWLWATRFFKTRALAKQAIEGGKIKLGEIAGKASKLVHVGDRLLVSRGEERFDVEVIALCEKRASAALAQTCYHEADSSRTARETAARLLSASW